MNLRTRSLVGCLLLCALLACSVALPAENGLGTAQAPDRKATAINLAVCPVTEPAWLKPPDDSAVQGSPGFEHYFVNDDRSIWASAWWAGEVGADAQMRNEGIKVGWFRPAGAALQITGRRIDGQAPPLQAEVPCCYPTRFQATGLYFPTGGCWEVTARAAESELSFVVWLKP